jgi:hypothetical protein
MDELDYTLSLSSDDGLDVTLYINGVAQEKINSTEFIKNIRNSDKIRDARYVKIISEIKKELKRIKAPMKKSPPVKLNIHYKCLHYYGKTEHDGGVIKRKVIVHPNGERYEGNDFFSRICKQSDRKYGRFKIDKTTLEDIIDRKIIDVVYYMGDWDSEYWFYPEDIMKKGVVKGKSILFDCDIGWLGERYL